MDLAKAYDQVPRDKLWECLQEYGVDGELLRAVQSLYKGSSACVRVNDTKSTPFLVGVGLRQGCVLSPILFATFMDRVEKRSRGTECVKIGDVEVSKLLFADDLALLASTQEDLQQALDRFAAECEVDGMKVNTSMTEVMAFSRQPMECTLHVSGAQLRQVEEFKYLGILFSSDGKQDKEISRRINAASTILRELWTVTGNGRISMQAKLAIFKALYRSCLTYGHESWILTERTRSRVQAAEMRSFGESQELPGWTTSGTPASERPWGVEPLILHTEKSQLRWYGHVLRMNPDRLVPRIMNAFPGERRPVGRPRTRWVDQVKELFRRTGKNPADAEFLAANRVMWKALTTSLPPRSERIRRA